MQIPRTCQCMLMSATTSEDVRRLQKLVLHNPTVIDCTEQASHPNDLAASNAAGTSSQIQHHSIQCNRLGDASLHVSCCAAPPVNDVITVADESSVSQPPCNSCDLIHKCTLHAASCSDETRPRGAGFMLCLLLICCCWDSQQTDMDI